MKRILFIIIIILIITGCNNKDALKNIIGTWNKENMQIEFNEDNTFTYKCINYKCDKRIVKEYIYEDERRYEECTITGTYKVSNGKDIYLYPDENTCNQANEKEVQYSFKEDYEIICLDDTSKCNKGLEKVDEDA